MTRSVEQRLKDRARDEGFDLVAVASADAPSAWGERLAEFVAQGHHGTMNWMAETLDRRKHPLRLWPDARSVIVLGMNYGPIIDPMERLKDKSCGTISVYALNRDYHDVIKGKLKTLAQWLARTTGSEVKVFVDTAPLMEKPLAEQAGIGWQGKHTNLVSRQLGSWLFLGSILTSADLQIDDGEQDHCGACRACLDICPTDAFPAPYQLDARRCISYLTIEHKGHIAREFRAAMGNRIFGCDDCLAVCPWNKFARAATEAKLAAREGLLRPDLTMLADLDDAAFRKLFSGSPVKRAGRDRFVRNVMIAIGNSGEASFLPIVERRLGDASPLVRAMAVWALGLLASKQEVSRLGETFGKRETDADVRREWRELN